MKSMNKKLWLGLLAMCVAEFSFASTAQAASFRSQMLEGSACHVVSQVYATRYPDTLSSQTMECPVISDSSFYLGDAHSVILYYNTSRSMTVSMRPCRLDANNYVWLGASCGQPASYTGKSGSQVWALATAGFSDLPGGRGWQTDAFYIEVTVSCDGKSSCTGYQLTTATVQQ